MSVELIEEALRSRPQGEAELAELAQAARNVSNDDLQYLIESMPAKQAAVLYRVLDKDTALNIFEDLPPAYQADLIRGLRSTDVAELIEDLDPDDRALVFDELPAAVADRLMAGLSPSERHMTASVLGYPPEAIGRYMSPEVIGINQDFTVGEAMAYVRRRIDDPETIYLLPVVDSSRKLTGVIGLRRLLSEDDSVVIRDIANQPVSASAIDDREETARRFLSEKLIAMPIVDREQRLVGILTIDDVIDIVEEEDTEDTARAGGSEPLAQSYLSASIFSIFRSRVVWLTMLAVSAVLTVQVLNVFEDRLAQLTALALFIPLLTGTGGNTGNQAATTVTRALAMGEVRVRDMPKIIWREARVGFTLGLTLGVLGFLAASLAFDVGIGTVIGLTLLSICTMAATIGGVMPLVAKKVGADPAVFSNPFISTFADATGLIIYFSIATAILLS